MKSYQLKIIKEAYTQGYNDACQGPLSEQRPPRGLGSIGRLADDYASIVAAQRAARRRAMNQFNKDVYNMNTADAVRKLRTSVGSGSDVLIQNAFYYMLKSLGRMQKIAGDQPFFKTIIKRMQEVVEDLLKRIREGTITQEEALIELYDMYGQFLPRPTGEPGSGVISGGINDFLRNVDPDSSILRLDDPSPSDLQRSHDLRVDRNPPQGREIIFPESELSPDSAEFLRRYQEFLDRFLEGGGLGGGSIDGP